MESQSEKRRGYLLVFAGSVCISFAPFFVKEAPIDASAVAFYRLVFGTAALFLVATVRRERLVPPRRTAQLMLLAGLLFSCDLLFWHASIVAVGPGIATILTNFQVIFLALYGALFLREVLSVQQKLSIPLALVGLALLLGLHESSLPPLVIKGTVFGLLSALFYSGYVLSLRKTGLVPETERLRPIANIAWVTLCAAAFVGLFCIGGGISLAIPDLQTGLILAALGLFCQAFGWLLLSTGLPLLPPFRAGLIMLTQPALSFVWDALFYGTATGFWNIVGAGLATAAIGMGIYTRSGRG